MSHLGITKTAVRAHIVSLEVLGFIRHEDSSGSVGRPKRRYFLSTEGTEAFPRQYAWLSSEVLSLMAESANPAQMTRFMQRLADKVSEQLAEKVKSTKSAARLKEILAVLNELGYRATIKQSDIKKGMVIEAINCVYHAVAQKHPELCCFDVQLLKNASKMNVKLESCIARGGTVCRFCFSK